MWKLVIVLSGLMIMSCSLQQGQKTALPLKVTVVPQQSCSKFVNLKDRYYIKPGSVIELSYTWHTDSNFKGFDRNLLVRAHFETENGDLVWLEDHMPSPPTSQWQANHDYTYSDLIEAPNKLVEPRLQLTIGLYDSNDLSSSFYLPDTQNKSQKKLVAAKFYAQPEERELFRDGWGVPEFGAEGKTSWRWIGNRAVYSFKNPEKFSFLTIAGSTLLDCFPEKPTIVISCNNHEIQRVKVVTAEFADSYPIPVDYLGSDDWCDLVISSDKTFMPSECKKTDDTRTLSFMITKIGIDDVVFRDGWFAEEKTKGSSWRWCGKKGVVQFGNPKTDMVLTIDGEIHAGLLNEKPSIEVSLNDVVLDKFTPDSTRIDHFYKLTSAQLGAASLANLTFSIDKVYQPNRNHPEVNDTRELGLKIKAIKVLPQQPAH